VNTVLLWSAGDLKPALAAAINAILQPVRDHFASDPKAKELLKKVKVRMHLLLTLLLTPLGVHCCCAIGSIDRLQIHGPFKLRLSGVMMCAPCCVQSYKVTR
jgi:hypothetical protein